MSTTTTCAICGNPTGNKGIEVKSENKDTLNCCTNVKCQLDLRRLGYVEVVPECKHCNELNCRKALCRLKTNPGKAKRECPQCGDRLGKKAYSPSCVTDNNVRCCSEECCKLQNEADEADKTVNCIRKNRGCKFEISKSEVTSEMECANDEIICPSCDKSHILCDVCNKRWRRGKDDLLKFKFRLTKNSRPLQVKLCAKCYINHEKYDELEPIEE